MFFGFIIATFLTYFYPTALHASKTDVLYIGDSHTVDPFGRELDGRLRKVFRVNTFGSCGSSPHWWFDNVDTKCGFWSRDDKGKSVRPPWDSVQPTPQILSLLETLKPKLVIVALGANLYQTKYSFVESSSEKMAKAITASGAKCVWVGPPNGRNKPEPRLGEVVEVIRNAVKAHCSFIDSRPFTYYPELHECTGLFDKCGDGIHFGQLGEQGKEISKKWAEEVFHLIVKGH